LLTVEPPRPQSRGKKNLFIAICFGDKTNWFLWSDVSEIHPFRTREKKMKNKIKNRTQILKLSFYSDVSFIYIRMYQYIIYIYIACYLYIYNNLYRHVGSRTRSEQKPTCSARKLRPWIVPMTLGFIIYYTLYFFNQNIF